MLKFKKLISLSALFLFLMIIQYFEGGHLGQLIQGTALFGVLGFTLLASVHHLGFHATWGGLASCLFCERPAWAEARGVDRFRAHSPTWAMFAANIMAVLGLIQVMAMLNEPAKIGHGIAVAFLSYVYGGFLVLLFGGTEVRDSSEVEKSQLQPVTALVPGVVLVMSFMTIMYAISDSDCSSRFKSGVPSTQNPDSTG